MYLLHSQVLVVLGTVYDRATAFLPLQRELLESSWFRSGGASTRTSCTTRPRSPRRATGRWSPTCTAARFGRPEEAVSYSPQSVISSPRPQIGVDAEEAHHLYSHLDFPGAVEDIRGAAVFLRAGGSKRVGVVGFCMGGALTLAAAARAPEVVDCAAPFYGIPPLALADPSTVTRPIQGHFGDKDAMAGFSSPADAAALRAALALSPAAAESEVFSYPTVGHGFVVSGREGHARREKAGNAPVCPLAERDSSRHCAPHQAAGARGWCARCRCCGARLGPRVHLLRQAPLGLSRVRRAGAIMPMMIMPRREEALLPDLS